ncbi:MAG: hypothetical protein CML17_00290 [Pusillimonas sp.]|nr:hypothetical protein [Pusillimonas sp.]
MKVPTYQRETGITPRAGAVPSGVRVSAGQLAEPARAMQAIARGVGDVGRVVYDDYQRRVKNQRDIEDLEINNQAKRAIAEIGAEAQIAAQEDPYTAENQYKKRIEDKIEEITAGVADPVRRQKLRLSIESLSFGQEIAVKDAARKSEIRKGFAALSEADRLAQIDIQQAQTSEEIAAAQERLSELYRYGAKNGYVLSEEVLGITRASQNSAAKQWMANKIASFTTIEEAEAFKKDMRTMVPSEILSQLTPEEITTYETTVINRRMAYLEDIEIELGAVEQAKQDAAVNRTLLDIEGGSIPLDQAGEQLDALLQAGLISRSTHKSSLDKAQTASSKKAETAINYREAMTGAGYKFDNGEIDDLYLGPHQQYEMNRLAQFADDKGTQYAEEQRGTIDFVRKTGRVPQTLKRQFNQAMRSGDPQAIQNMISLYDKGLATDEALVFEGMVDDDTQAFVNEYHEAFKLGVEPQQAFKYTQGFLTRNKERINEVNRQIREGDYLEDIVEEVQNIIGESSQSVQIDAKLAYESTFTSALLQGNSPEAAHSFARQRLENAYSPSVFGGAMMYAPEKFSTLNVNGYEWIKDDMEKSVEEYVVAGRNEPRFEYDKDNISLISDEITARDATTGFPTYKIAVLNNDGMIEVIPNRFVLYDKHKGGNVDIISPERERVKTLNIEELEAERELAYLKSYAVREAVYESKKRARGPRKPMPRIGDVKASDIYGEAAPLSALGGAMMQVLEAEYEIAMAAYATKISFSRWVSSLKAEKINEFKEIANRQREKLGLEPRFDIEAVTDAAD